MQDDLTELHEYPRALFGGAEVFTLEDEDTGEPLRVLYVGGGFQSATFIDERRFELVFEYYKAFDRLFDALRVTRPEVLGETAAEFSPHDAHAGILMLGAGGCSYPKYLVSHFPHVSVDAVEIDPVVLGIAREHFYVNEALDRFDAHDRLNLIAADAREFLAAEGKRYDAVLNDCFGGRELVRELASVSAARAVQDRLNPGGVYLANVVSADEGSDISTVQNVATTLAQVFAQVCVVACFDEDYAGEDNYLVMATDAPFTFPDALPQDIALAGSVIDE